MKGTRTVIWSCIFAWISEKDIWQRNSQNISKGKFWGVKFVLISIIIIVFVEFLLYSKPLWALLLIFLTILQGKYYYPHLTWGSQMLNHVQRSYCQLRQSWNLLFFLNSKLWALIILGSANSFFKGPDGIFTFAGQMMCVATTHFCCCSM